MQTDTYKNHYRHTHIYVWIIKYTSSRKSHYIHTYRKESLHTYTIIICGILSVNGFIEWSANIFGSFGANFVFFFFFYWLALVFDENLCVAEELYYDWLESLEVGCLLLLALPTEIHHSQLKQEALELGSVFYSSTQMELSKKN